MIPDCFNQNKRVLHIFLLRFWSGKVCINTGFDRFEIKTGLSFQICVFKRFQVVLVNENILFIHASYAINNSGAS